ncbi:MAG: hypothetical protein MUF15_06325 [Acidobacteria bacterium]|nr:hypothetical protein [Acidobacteriota bacterium]
MSLKLSRNKINCLSSLVARYIEKNEDIDYSGDIGNIRLKIFHLITNELRLFEQIENPPAYKSRRMEYVTGH